MAQFLIKYEERSIYTVLVEGVNTLDEAKELVSTGPELIDEDIGTTTWSEKVSTVKAEPTTRPIVATTAIDLQ